MRKILLFGGALGLLFVAGGVKVWRSTKMEKDTRPERFHGRPAFHVNGWIMASNLGLHFRMNKEKDAALITKYEEGREPASNEAAVWAHVYPEDCPYSDIEEAIPQLKTEKNISEIEVKVWNDRKWLTHKQRIKGKDVYVAHTLIAPKKFVTVRGTGAEVKEAWLDVLSFVEIPKNIAY